MVKKSTVKYLAVSLLKGILASIIGLIGLIIGSVIPALLGLSAPPVPEAVDPNLLMLLYIPVGIIVPITLGELFKRLNQNFWERFLSILLFNYLVYGFLQVLEQILFTTTMTLAYGTISNLIQSILTSLAIASLWKPSQTNVSIMSELPKYFARRKAVDWAWRIILAWVLYVPIYLIMGVIISPFVTPYYTDPTLGFGTTLPRQEDIIATQFIRGALYLLSAFPIIVLWKESKNILGLWVGFSIFIQIAALPILLAYWYPLAFKIPHAIELAVSSFAQAFIYAQLLFLGARK